ncbi:MAG: hypothetical protein ACFB22_10305 [Rhodothalassiaceae bacterium]
MKLSEDEARRIRRAEAALAAFQDEMATVLPGQIGLMREALSDENFAGLKRRADDLRDLTGTMNWQTIAEAAKHLSVAVTARKPGFVINEILDLTMELGRAAHRTVTPDNRPLLSRIAQLAHAEDI